MRAGEEGWGDGDEGCGWWWCGEGCGEGGGGRGCDDGGGGVVAFGAGPAIPSCVP